MKPTNKLYTELAAWWPLFSPPADYEEEAGFYLRTLRDACARPPRRVLELGSGGGNNASYMKAHCELTLVDLSPAMLEVSRRLNPGCEHAQGDMRTLRLGRTFDAVFVQDAVCYLTSERDLAAAIETAFVHCAAGGAALFAPDYVRENFVAPSSDHGGSDGPDRGIRYLEWVWDPDPDDTTYLVDYAFLFREPDGRVHVEHDRHVEGLFPRATWIRLLADAGFTPRVVPFPHSELDWVPEVFVGVKPA